MSDMIGDNCFACGKANPIGLKLDFSYETDFATCSFTLGRVFEGYKSLVHGGIISTILDESMAKIIINKGYIAVTAKIEIKFSNPLLVGKPAEVEATILQKKKRIIVATSQIKSADGKLIAKAMGKFIEVADS